MRNGVSKFPQSQVLTGCAFRRVGLAGVVAGAAVSMFRP
jgi:hypothetical protein